MRSNWRFTRGAFLRRLWLFMPLVRMILPLAVILNRFLAPLWVFILIFFGLAGALISSGSFLVAFPFPFSFPVRHARLRLERRHEHGHGPALHPWRRLDGAVGTELVGKLIEQRLAQVRVGHLAATEEDGQFDLVPGVEELGGLAPFRLQVVVVDLGPDTDLFQLDGVLVTARLALFAALLVAKLAVVHEPADGGHRIGSHLDQVETPLARHLKRIKGGDDADLLAVLVDQPDLADPDALIDAGLDGSGNSLPPFFPLPGYANQHRNAPGAISGAVALKARGEL
jgi:hypothetical protein